MEGGPTSSAPCLWGKSWGDARVPLPDETLQEAELCSPREERRRREENRRPQAPRPRLPLALTLTLAVSVARGFPAAQGPSGARSPRAARTCRGVLSVSSAPPSVHPRGWGWGGPGLGVGWARAGWLWLPWVPRGPSGLARGRGVFETLRGWVRGTQSSASTFRDSGEARPLGVGGGRADQGGLERVTLGSSVPGQSLRRGEIISAEGLATF